jgi:hypothetical protein
VRERCTLDLGRCSVQISVGSPAILTKIFCGFLQSFQEDSGIVPQIGRGHLFPNPFQFIAHLFSYNSMLCNLRYWKRHQVNPYKIIKLLVLGNGVNSFRDIRNYLAAIYKHLHSRNAFFFAFREIFELLMEKVSEIERRRVNIFHK